MEDTTHIRANGSSRTNLCPARGGEAAEIPALATCSMCLASHYRAEERKYNILHTSPLVVVQRLAPLQTGDAEWRTVIKYTETSPGVTRNDRLEFAGPRRRIDARREMKAYADDHPGTLYRMVEITTEVLG